PFFTPPSLLPYNDLSKFHPHPDPEPFQISDPALSVSRILNCRKIGHCYEYLVPWSDLPDTEDSWVPLSDI
ncbi:hypothetical protein BDN70DRAFT_767555, partial [Pholiota conissans]